MHTKRLLDLSSPYNGTGIGLEVVTLPPGGLLHAKEHVGQEAVIVLLGGTGVFHCFPQNDPEQILVPVQRDSLLDETPTAMSLSTNTSWAVSADEYSEITFAVVTTANDREFAPSVIDPEDVSDEERGQGLADGTMHRKVRAVFGDPLAPVIIPESNLVVGEVVNFPGRWSSYPPHGHPHPEMYYYRFPKGGFGISVQGDGAEPSANVARVVRDGDVEQILDGMGHAQAAAPGYPMWYLWVVRHLPGNRYEGNPPFSFYEAHEWVNDPDAEIWTPNR